MDRIAPSKTITLPAACARLGISWAQGWRLALRGELSAWKEGGRWLCAADQVERVRRERAAAKTSTEA